jgi:hypothetical protein
VIPALALALLCAGCGHSTVNVQGSGVGASGFFAPGTSVSGGSLGGGFQGASTAASLFGIALLGAALHYSDRAPAPMDETRRVQLVDCTRPIEDWSANLRCR